MNLGNIRMTRCLKITTKNTLIIPKIIILIAMKKNNKKNNKNKNIRIMMIIVMIRITTIPIKIKIIIKIPTFSIQKPLISVITMKKKSTK